MNDEELLRHLDEYLEPPADPNPEMAGINIIPNRTIFWGATRRDSWIVIVCEDWKEDDTRYLRPVTAFEPEEGVKYWEEYQ